MSYKYSISELEKSGGINLPGSFLCVFSLSLYFFLISLPTFAFSMSSSVGWLFPILPEQVIR